MSNALSNRADWNCGLDILRVIMCYSVIISHFRGVLLPLPAALRAVVSAILGIHVCVFMFISFFLMSGLFTPPHSPAALRRRIRRLLYPHIVWSLIYWVVYSLLSVWGPGLSLKSRFSLLLWQLFTGHSINTAMWFQVDLILLTLLFAAARIFFAEDRHFIAFLAAIMLCALLAQYTGLNLALFGGLRDELRYPLGRLFEVLPCAVMGYLAGHYRILQRLRKDWRLLILFSVPLCVLLRISINTPEGFNYAGLWRTLLSAVFVAAFYVLPLENLPGRVLRFLYAATRYTFGIYCMHFLVGRCLDFFATHLGTPLVFVPGHGLLIYICCYAASAVIAHFSAKRLRSLVV